MKLPFAKSSLVPALLGAAVLVGLPATANASTPPAPDVLAVPFDGTVQLSWTAHYGVNATECVSYKIRTSGGAPIATVSSGGDYTVTGLTNGVAVQFIVDCETAFDGTYLGDLTSPVKPGVLGATNVTATPGDGKVTVNWADSVNSRCDPYGGVDDYFVVRVVNPNDASSDVTVAQVAPGVHSAVIGNLTNGVAVQFAVTKTCYNFNQTGLVPIRTLGPTVTPTAQSTPPLTPPGPTGPIVGTPGPDVLQGTAGDDVIFGLGGNDKIFGNGGNDLIIGGGGNDKLFGLDGNDTLKGGKGTDKCVGGNGTDTAKKCEKVRTVP